MEINTSGKQYYQNLNTLRCMAAFFVIMYHWFITKMSFFPFAKIGVDIFFVLSGFLITEILIKSKKSITGDIPSKWGAVGRFYAKRALRIFPAYFLLITIFFLIKYPPLGHDWINLFTYTTNFLIYFKREWIYPLSPMWTLAVEEQFYIVWPFILIFFGRYWHPRLIFTVIILSIVFIILDARRNEFFFVLPFSCMSTLGMGALLAYLKNERQEVFLRYKSYALPVFLVLALVFCIFSSSFNFLTQHLLIAVIAFLLIAYSITTTNYLFNKVFSNPVTSYLGKISYGLYLYHHPIPWLVRNLNGTETQVTLHIPKILPAFTSGYMIFLENLTVLLVIATLSWFLMEKPINSLKERFQ